MDKIIVTNMLLCKGASINEDNTLDLNGIMFEIEVDNLPCHFPIAVFIGLDNPSEKATFKVKVDVHHESYEGPIGGWEERELSFDEQYGHVFVAPRYPCDDLGQYTFKTFVNQTFCKQATLTVLPTESLRKRLEKNER